MRVFAAAAIVWFHVVAGYGDGPLGGFFGGIGLMLFCYISFLTAGEERGFSNFLKRRAKQLLIPWTAWWLIYAATRIWSAGGLPAELENSFSIWTLLAWPAIHLWYLPFIFFASFGVQLFFQITAKISEQLKIALSAGTALAILPLLAIVPDLPPPAGIIVTVLPTIGLGLAYGFCLGIDSRQKRVSWFTAIAVLVATACVPIWLWGDHTTATAYTGASLLMVVFNFPLKRNRFVMRLSTLTLGIYLAHPFVMLVLWKFFGTNRAQWLFALATFVLAALMTWIIRKIPYLRTIA